MVKQIQIFLSDSKDELQQDINNFCIEFFPEEIVSIKISIVKNDNKIQWLGYIIYNKNGY